MPDEILSIPEITDKQITLAPSYLARRDELLSESREIQSIDENDSLTFDTAVLKYAALNALKSETEKSRQVVKKEPLRIGKLIDSLAKLFTDPIEAEAARLGKLIMPIEKKRRAVAAEAEQAKKALTLAYIPTVAEGDDDPLGIREAQREELNTRLATIPKTPGASSGVRMLATLVVEVTDPAALYAHSPHLVKLEGKLTEIKAALSLEKAKAGADWDKVPQGILPGVTWRIDEKPSATGR